MSTISTKKSLPQKSRGFTLIELLVVIAIIGLLSAVVLASLNTARNNALDARRLSDVQQIGLAIQQVADDNGGVYPSAGGAAACLGTGGTCWGGAYSGSAALNTAISKYIAIPSDPTVTTGNGDRYLYVDPTGVAAYHCATTINGPLIVWIPAAGSASTDAACKNTTYYGCCIGGVCSPNGIGQYSCIYQISK
jgi:prepilin-type N-terminal cleavage/methylation domain-containing protein